MNNLINPEDKQKPSNCVSYHDDVCFADHELDQDKQD
tara:strand:+ start:223 stop:333 length:111 start_codon:yes stop_codon:yes gene_type:complete